jgi:nucleoside-diphosphate-sugar epimerase
MNKKKIIIIGKNSFISQKFVNKFSEKKNIYIVKKKNNYYSKPNWLNLIGKDTTIVFFAFDNSLISQKKKFFLFNKKIFNFFRVFENYLKKKNISPNIVFTSTVTVYGNTKLNIVNESFKLNPQTEYDISKIFFEQLLQKLSINYNLKVTILRLSNVLGLPTISEQKDRGILNKIIKKIKNNEIIKIYGSGNYLRDYIYIDDLIDGIIKSIKVCKPGIYNLCSGKSYSLIYILKKIEKIMNVQINKKFVDFPKNYSSIEKRNFKGSNKKFSKNFNWKVKFKLDKGLKKLYKDIR